MKTSILLRYVRRGSGAVGIQITTGATLDPNLMLAGNQIGTAFVAGTYPDFKGNAVSESLVEYFVNDVLQLPTYVLQAGDLVGQARVTLSAAGATNKVYYSGIETIVDYSYDPGALEWEVPSVGGDVTAPTISSTNPANHAVDEPIDTDIIVVFDESITFGTGNIVLRENNGGWADLEVFDVTTHVGAGAGQVSISTNTLTIRPTSDLANGREYAIRIAATAIKDLSGNAFAGIADDTTISFTTTATAGSGLVGYDAPIVLKTTTTATSFGAGLWTIPVVAGELITAEVHTTGNAVVLVPANITVTIGGVPMTLEGNTATTGTGVFPGSASFSLIAPTTGTLEVIVNTGVSTRECVVILRRITGYDPADPVGAATGPAQLATNTLTLTSGAMNISAIDNAVIGSVCSRAVTATLASSTTLDGVAFDKTGATAGNDLSFASGHKLMAAAGSFAPEITLNVAERMSGVFLEIQKAPTAPAQPGSSSRYDEVNLLRGRIREVVNAAGVTVTATNTDVSSWPSIDAGASIPAGITVTADEVIVDNFAGDLHLNIGNRQLTLNAGADIGELRIYGMAPSSKLAGVLVNVGARVRSMNGSILDGSLGVSKAVFQSHAGGGPTVQIGSIDEIVDCQFINQQGDGPKIAGSAFGVMRIESNIFGQQESGYSGAHYDQTTIMSAINGLLIRGNIYDQLVDTDTVGVNNWLQFAPYWDYAIYGDIMVTENIMTHMSTNSFAMMKGSQYIGTAQFGRIDFVNNWFRKAGDIRNIFYGKDNFATSFTGNINLDTGLVFTV